MSKTIILSNNEAKVNIVFGQDVGMYIQPRNKPSKKIARELYKMIQKRLNHNRNAMSWEKNWRVSIEEIKQKHNMEEESYVWQEMLQNTKEPKSPQ